MGKLQQSPSSSSKVPNSLSNTASNRSTKSNKSDTTTTTTTSSSSSSTNGAKVEKPKGSLNVRTTNEEENNPISRIQIRRRGKRESEVSYEKILLQSSVPITTITKATAVKQTTSKVAVKTKSSSTTTTSSSRAYQKHNADKPSGGIEALLPSAIGLAILICGVMAKMGFRGRATVAGIDLGTTNSVICVQAPAKGVGVIECLPDPITNSPIVPSVVSFLEPHEWKVGPSSKVPSLLNPHPSTVIVGTAAKQRIDSHPQSTLYNAKRILGRPYSDNAVSILQKEVEFAIHENDDETENGVHFTVPNTLQRISPVQVGGYVVNHLKNIMDIALGHENVRSAVICVPAKFDAKQRQLTVDAFTMAGIKVVRIVEEPTSAALAYGLHRKPNVDYILVYDFGGGTLDVSLLYVTDGFVDVMGSDGDDNLGGTDFDIVIAQYLQNEKGGQGIIDTTTNVLQSIAGNKNNIGKHSNVDDAIIQKCSKLLHQAIPLCTVSSFHTIGEQLKIQLSNKYYEATVKNDTASTESEDTEADNTNVIESITASAQCYGLPTNNGDDTIQSFDDFCTSLIPHTLSITQGEFNSMAKDLFDRSINPVKRLINDLDLQITDIDEIVMVGGTTRMPQIRTIVQQYMYHIQQLNTHIDPDLTVAYGAASVID